MNLDLTGKTALVGGSTQGIGRASAIELALLGANVVLMARNEETLKATLADLDATKGQLHRYLVIDFSQPGAVAKYLDMLSNNPPTDNWSSNEQIAYWINAYNAFTIQLILTHYPVASSKDIGSRIQIPFVTTPWASKFFSIGGNEMSLDKIDRILRKQFNEPRIHFALAPAARSGPRLRNEAYYSDKLIAQLDEQGSNFLNNPAKNAISPQRASLSKIFDWYKSDWQKSNRSVDYWVNRYSSAKVNRDTPISYLDYDWALNEQ